MRYLFVSHAFVDSNGNRDCEQGHSNENGIKSGLFCVGSVAMWTGDEFVECDLGVPSWQFLDKCGEFESQRMNKSRHQLKKKGLVSKWFFVHRGLARSADFSCILKYSEVPTIIQWIIIGPRF